ncbi:SAG family member [Eimeria acervulina]|uniref:SAG family member n=1 Tax=Eimeria acervulina TaxID=5801 RepID=U6GNT5_EIMAC|nr:SAG family member [Eimeria acervulina]CDI81232.1 SAG family member [Eimeria acervulina]
MGLIFKSSAFCLVALYGFQLATAATTFAAEDVTDDMYLSANLARNGKLSVHINELEKADDMVKTLKTALGDGTGLTTADTCDNMTLGASLKLTFSVKFTQETSKATNYRDMVQTALNKGLGQLPTYPSTWDAFWSNPDGANLANLLWSQSTKIACAVGVCTDDTPLSSGKEAILVCQFSPAAQQNAAPFSKEYYDALHARNTPITEMTEADLKESSTGGAAAAVPSLLFASLITILATAAA